MQVEILRGIPGSGKSHFIKERIEFLKRNEQVCSADTYMPEEGSYIFRPEKLPEAHRRCQLQALHYIAEGMLDVLWIDNTNIHAWELGFYIGVCNIYKIEYKILTFLPSDGLWSRFALRNTHGVSIEKCWEMWKNLQREKLPPHWNQKVVLV